MVYIDFGKGLTADGTVSWTHYNNTGGQDFKLFRIDR